MFTAALYSGKVWQTQSSMERIHMKLNAPTVIGGLFVAYLFVVATVMLTQEFNPNNMDWDDRETYNKQTISGLDIGQTKQDILDLLGQADFSEAKQYAQGTLTILFYRTQRKHSDGQTTRDECTPLLFKNGQLIAWGIETYQQYLTTPITVL